MFNTHHVRIASRAIALLLLALAVAGSGAARAGDDLMIASQRRSGYLPQAHRLLIVMDTPGLFAYRDKKGDILPDEEGGAFADPSFFAVKLAQRLRARLEEATVAAGYVMVGFAETDPALVDSLQRAFACDAVLHVATVAEVATVKPTLAQILADQVLPGLGTAFPKSGKRVLDELDLDLWIAGPTDPQRKVWSAYLQAARPSGGDLAFADEVAVAIVKQLAADDAVPAPGPGSLRKLRREAPEAQIDD